MELWMLVMSVCYNYRIYGFGIMGIHTYYGYVRYQLTTLIIVERPQIQQLILPKQYNIIQTQERAEMSWGNFNDSYNYNDQSSIAINPNQYSQIDEDQLMMLNLQNYQGIDIGIVNAHENKKPLKKSGKTQLKLFHEVLWVYGEQNSELYRVLTDNFRIIYGQYLTPMSDKNDIVTYIKQKQQQLETLSQIACKNHQDHTLIPVLLVICTADMLQFYEQQLLNLPHVYNKCVLYRGESKKDCVYRSIRQVFDVIKQVQLLQKDLINKYQIDLYQMYQYFNLELNPNIFILEEEPINIPQPQPQQIAQASSEINQIADNPNLQQHDPNVESTTNTNQHQPAQQQQQQQQQQEKQQQNRQSQGQQQHRQKQQEQQQQQQQQAQEQEQEQYQYRYSEQEQQQQQEQEQMEQQQGSITSNKQLKQKIQQKIASDLLHNEFYIFLDPMSTAFILITTPQTKQFLQQQSLQSDSFLIMTHQQMQTYINTNIHCDKIILISTQFHRYFQLLDECQSIYAWVRCMWGSEELDFDEQELYGDRYADLKDVHGSFEGRVFDAYSVEELNEKLQEIQNNIENQMY